MAAKEGEIESEERENGEEAKKEVEPKQEGGESQQEMEQQEEKSLVEEGDKKGVEPRQVGEEQKEDRKGVELRQEGEEHKNGVEPDERTGEEQEGEESGNDRNGMELEPEESKEEGEKLEQEGMELEESKEEVEPVEAEKRDDPAIHGEKNIDVHSTDELLAIMGASSPPQRNSFSESSSDSLLSDFPCFLHIRVSHKSCASHVYVPINSSVGIDIPRDRQFLSPTKGTVQQVKTTFCFAVAEKR